MIRRIAVVMLLLLPGAAAVAQQPTPLFNTLPGNPPPAAAVPVAPSDAPSDVPLPSPAPPSQAGRDFCGQTISAHPADPASVPDRYRQFVGIFSDAAWNSQVCAALVVETIADDGTATVIYVFGANGAGGRTPGGVLHGSGIVKDGALLFQNSDGSQYAFQPFYSDLAGRWTTPQGQTYEAIFKRSF
jgi:hypothetical protein